jgi:hypothetical protein
MNAFPVQFLNGKSQSGMTLRDYFAGQALAGNLEQGIEDDFNSRWWHDPEKIAARAYEIADAMMDVRKFK